MGKVPDLRLKQTIAAQLPFLRRYARALTGTQALGDGYVREWLQRLLRRPIEISPDRTKLQLFQLFHELLPEISGPADVSEDGGSTDVVQQRVRERVASLPVGHRQALLLVQTEGFSNAEAAAILQIKQSELEARLDAAWSELRRQKSTRALIIEDEPLIALDIAGIVNELGHEVSGIATSSSQAVELAKAKMPGLILADIQLDDGSTGINAVEKILASSEVPVVFVTAFPERLLTGERLEPTFVVTKPFDNDTLKVVISQALFCGASFPSSASGGPRAA